MDLGCLGNRNIESRKCCFEQSAINNRISRRGIEIEGQCNKTNGERIKDEWKLTRKRVKTVLQKRTKQVKLGLDFFFKFVDQFITPIVIILQ